MAFDRKDTDKVYDKLIVPTLRKLSAYPVRVDRIEHNEDINDKIIDELNKCDFAVADLTHARPSAYFEAGYAEREVPVVYTCRRDHSRPRPEDVHGNFRVHFDLQMKNIIWWSNPADGNFAKRFERRLKHVMAPLLRARRTHEEDEGAARAFKSLSLIDKRKLVRSVTASELSSAGYKVKQPKRWPPDWVAYRRSNGSFRLAGVCILTDTSKKELTFLTNVIFLYLASEFWDTQPKRQRERPIIRGMDLFLCTHAKIPQIRASDAFYRFSYSQELDCYLTGTVVPADLGGQGEERIHIIDGISSEKALRTELQNRLRRGRKS